MTTSPNELAVALQRHQSGQFGEAEALYRALLQREPEHAEALQLYGALLLQTGRPAEAIEWMARSIAVTGGNAAVLSNLGSAHLAVGDARRAREALEAAIRHDPRMAPAHYNLAKAHTALGELEAAATAYCRALELQPDMSAAHGNLVDVYRQLGQFDEALRHFDRALELAPQLATAHYNRALVLLSQGHLAEGWAEYEWRWQCPAAPKRSLAVPQWDGRHTSASVLVHAEQGLGDTLQFIRLVPLLCARCPHLIVEVQRPLVPLLRQSGFNVHAAGEPLPPFELHLPLLSAPRVLGITLETVPKTVPYLTPDPRLVAQHAARLQNAGPLRVGIAWQGRTSYPEDRFRSIPLAHFAPLAQVRGVTLFSLQKGPGTEQIPLVQPRFSVVDLGSAADEAAGPLMDTAAIMAHLDLVVTSDSALAHLAGALGVPVWLATAHVPDWRWLTGRSDSPWYPTMRLFRQPRRGDWTSVFGEMAAALAALKPRSG